MPSAVNGAPARSRSIGLGCMRLSTSTEREDARATAVIHAALDAGATLLDSADAYGLDEQDVGHNERLIAQALREWKGDRGGITVATKGGLRRPNGAWIPDGRARHLRAACDASRRALGVDTIDLYQLHVVDPRTPIETSVRALARLQAEGRIREIGLCNVTVSQVEAARSIAAIASVQVSLSPLDDTSLRNGVADYCREHGLRLIAHRPLGGERVSRLARDTVLASVAAKHAASAAEVALAWLMGFGRDVVPIPGATRLETAQSLARALALELDDEDRERLDARFSGRLLRVSRRERQPGASGSGDVVLVMGMPGAGKSTLARELEAAGYQRLNRDTRGGSLAALASSLDEMLAGGGRRVVLDNTYPTRKSRNEVIEAAWRHGVPVRCVWLETDLGDAQINSIRRMLDAHGSLPMPDEIRRRAREDPRYLLPEAQFRYERTLERPTVDEGFASVEVREFVRDVDEAGARALILDFDDLIGDGAPVLRPEDVRVDEARRAAVRPHVEPGGHLFIHAWRPQVDRKEITREQVESCFTAMRASLGVPVELSCCPHDAGPPVCWCRKPIPGAVLELAAHHGVAVSRSTVVGTSAADRTMAARLGARFEPSESFFGTKKKV